MVNEYYINGMANSAAAVLTDSATTKDANLVRDQPLSCAVALMARLTGMSFGELWVSAARADALAEARRRWGEGAYAIERPNDPPESRFFVGPPGGIFGAAAAGHNQGVYGIGATWGTAFADADLRASERQDMGSSAVVVDESGARLSIRNECEGVFLVVQNDPWTSDVRLDRASGERLIAALREHVCPGAAYGFAGRCEVDAEIGGGHLTFELDGDKVAARISSPGVSSTKTIEITIGSESAGRLGIELHKLVGAPYRKGDRGDLERINELMTELDRAKAATAEEVERLRTQLDQAHALLGAQRALLRRHVEPAITFEAAMLSRDMVSEARDALDDISVAALDEARDHTAQLEQLDEESGARRAGLADVADRAGDVARARDQGMRALVTIRRTIDDVISRLGSSACAPERAETAAAIAEQQAAAVEKARAA